MHQGVKPRNHSVASRPLSAALGVTQHDRSGTGRLSTQPPFKSLGFLHELFLTDVLGLLQKCESGPHISRTSKDLP